MSFSEIKISDGYGCFKLLITNECDSIADVIIDTHFTGRAIPPATAVKYSPLFQLLAAFDSHGRFLLDSALFDLYQEGAPVRYEVFARACENFLLTKEDVSWVQVVSPLALLGRVAQSARESGLLKVQVAYFREYVGRFLTENDDAYEFLRQHATKEGVFVNIDRDVRQARRRAILNVLEFSLLAVVTVLKYL